VAESPGCREERSKIAQTTELLGVASPTLCAIEALATTKMSLKEGHARLFGMR